MNKKDWKDKKKVFLDMIVLAEKNKEAAEKNLEELHLFLEAVRTKIKTFK